MWHEYLLPLPRLCWERAGVAWWKQLNLGSLGWFAMSCSTPFKSWLINGKWKVQSAKWLGKSGRFILHFSIFNFHFSLSVRSARFGTKFYFHQATPALSPAKPGEREEIFVSRCISSKHPCILDLNISIRHACPSCIQAFTSDSNQIQVAFKAEGSISQRPLQT